jgi:type I restriction enzyme S subunit
MLSAMSSDSTNWSVVTLADVASDVTYGYTASAAERPVGPKFLRVTDVVGGQVDWHAVPHCEIDDRQVDKYRLEDGDLVVVRTGPVGESALVSARAPNAVFASYLVRFRLVRDVALPQFVKYVLRSPGWWSYVDGTRTGSVQPQLNATLMKAFELRLPPIGEQQRIAGVLGALDDKIEHNRRVSRRLEDWCAARFAVAVGRPSGWTRLNDALATLETGGRPKGGVSEYTDGVPSIGAESIVGVGVFDYSKTKYVPRDYFAAMQRGVVENGDVLLYKDGGRPGEFEPHTTLVGHGFPFNEMAINEHVYRLRSRAPYSQEFLYLWLRTPIAVDEMRMRGTGVAVPGLNSTAVRELAVPEMKVESIQRVTETVRPALGLILHRARESRDLARLRDALLPKLVSGKIRVPERYGPNDALGRLVAQAARS